MKATGSLAIIAALSAGIHGHGIVSSYIVGTKTIQGYNPNFQYSATAPIVAGWTAPATQDTGPVPGTSLNDPDIICARGATNGQGYVDIAAGDSITMLWTVWPDSHKGPMIDYLANCNGDCTTIDKTELQFVKINGVGMVDTTGSPPVFADDMMIANNSAWEVTIPASIKPGQYVLRHETIALHQAQSAGGSQPYPQCVNLNITGSGTDPLSSGTPGTALYSESDPGIMFNIYTSFTNTAQYTVPGPSLYSGAANYAQGGGATSTGKTAAETPTSAASNGRRPAEGAVTAATKVVGPVTVTKTVTAACTPENQKRHARNFATVGAIGSL